MKTEGTMHRNKSLPRRIIFIACLWVAAIAFAPRPVNANPAPNDIVSMAWSPDSRRIASGHWDGAIRIWDVATGKLPTTLTGHKGRCSQ
jgi:WD40 repeat protein